jgi:putative proteasome-type protease
MVVYEADRLESDKVVCIDENNPYFQMMHNTWGEKLREVFDGIEDPVWNGAATATPLLQPAQRNETLKKINSHEEKLI